MNRLMLGVCVFICSCVVTVELHAHGPVAGKVHHPYVLPNEREFEWGLDSRSRNGTNVLVQSFGFGHAISEHVSIEGFLSGESDDRHGFQLSSYEVEARWMLTEQGEYWADWGTLFELVKERGHDQWEVSAAVLSEKEFGRTSLTLNLFGIFGFGGSVANEWESELRLKYRYRWVPQLQPAIEIFLGEDFKGVGPAFMGIQRFNGRKQLKWGAAFIVEVSKGGVDETIHLEFEYEF